MEGNYLQLNFVNFVTVVLMAAVGMICIGAVTAGVKKFTSVS